MNKQPVNRPTTPVSPYGPATGVPDPGLKPPVCDTPYTGDYGPDGQYKPGFVDDGPGRQE